jgi:hypothetical protein
MFLRRFFLLIVVLERLQTSEPRTILDIAKLIFKNKTDIYSLVMQTNAQVYINLQYSLSGSLEEKIK